MQTPFVVKPNLSSQELQNFTQRFSISNGNDCSIRENVWRRHQCPENAEHSGWQDNNDQRRIIIHFRDKYAIIDGDFCLVEYYLLIHLLHRLLEYLQHML